MPRSFLIWAEVGGRNLEKFFTKSVDDTYRELETGPEGLSSPEAESRLLKYGENRLQEEKKKSLLTRIIEEFIDPMIIILLAASGLSAFVGEKEDAIIILAIVTLNAVLSIIQEGKSEEALAALKEMSSPHARVIRDGQIIDVETKVLVPGDLVSLETGDIVPADLRLISSENLQIDESSLTGESVPAEKFYTDLHEDDTGVGDRTNMAFSSTIVTYGRGKGVVVGTGENTEIGKIATSLAEVKEEMTPLQQRLNGLSKTLAAVILVVVVAVFGIGYMQGRDPLEMFMIAISLAVAAIPEGLPAIVTIVLSLGMTRMAKKHAIVKKLLSVETLGTTTYICSDKTGTLTQNEMTVQKVYLPEQMIDIEGIGYNPEGSINEGAENDDFKLLASLGVLNNDGTLVPGDNYSLIGDPTEGSLLTLGEKTGITKSELENQYPRLKEIPFDSERKLMSTVSENLLGDGYIQSTKGAPDVLLSRCSKVRIDGEVQDLTDEIRNKILEANSSMARSALRVLALGYKEYNELPDMSTEGIEEDIVFVGLVGIIDPAREEAKVAITECKSAGIVPVMITGDHLDTAVAIAKDLGIATSEEQAMTGTELDQYSESELREIVKRIRVYARVSPENKVQIVKALKANGEVVAMTGDGVNDAPAIRGADIGIAMGITGTDVAKNTADVILTDDNFATIVHSVEEGRIIYSNIKKFVSFLLSCNIGEVLIVFFALILGLPVPFSAKQLLWLNLVTDSFPALALGVESGEPDIMKRAPRDPEEPILDKKVTRMLIVQSVALTVVSLGVYYWALKSFGGDLLIARTMAFLTLTLSELFRAFSARSDRLNIWDMGLFTNMRIIQGVGVSTVLTLLVVFVPFLRDVFDLVLPTANQWIMVIGLSLVPMIAAEVLKMITKEK